MTASITNPAFTRWMREIPATYFSAGFMTTSSAVPIWIIAPLFVIRDAIA
ncbi:hypothetical protein [Arenibacterium halophilum]|nr:hypothetical protein [Arenibacterium halophilum]